MLAHGAGNPGGGGVGGAAGGVGGAAGGGGGEPTVIATAIRCPFRQ